MDDRTMHVWTTKPPHSAEDVIEKFGFHSGQIVWSADGSDAYSLTDVIREAWAEGAATRSTETDRG